MAAKNRESGEDLERIRIVGSEPTIFRMIFGKIRVKKHLGVKNGRFHMSFWGVVGAIIVALLIFCFL